MKRKIDLTLTAFEKISESKGQTLIGGFSQSFTIDRGSLDLAAANNCKGGNCAVLCGSNVGCNAKEGCGATL